jgi:SM-20-related protein
VSAGLATREQPQPDEQIASQLSDTGIALMPRYLPEVQWRAFARETRGLHAHRAFRAAGIGRGPSFRIAPEVRSDRVHWIDPLRPTRHQAAWFARMDALRSELNQRLYLGLSGFEAHLAHYGPGERYRTHLDRFADASHRRVSVLLYLNEDWGPGDGGQLRLYLEGADRAPWRDVAPAGGTLVAFLSDTTPHEVLPAARERWSVAGWFTARA